MGAKVDGGGGPINDINVTPMVDVMLVLLIIFMVITPMLQSGVTVNIPEGKNPVEDKAIDKESSVVISIPNDAEIWVGRERYFDLKDVTKEVDNRLKDKPGDQQIVYIKTDQVASYGKLVEVINAVRDAGYDRIGLVAKKLKEKKGGAQG
jgi:biopolymer transport protein ExbD